MSNLLRSDSLRTIRLGTRASDLARWQAEWVAKLLRESGAQVEIVLITTKGDTTSGPIKESGSQGLFTKEIQRALLDGRADLAVHSLKDLPTDPVDGLSLAAVPARAGCGDAFVSNQVTSLEQLESGSLVGTGSMRRRTQLLHARPDLQIAGIRGNVDTRLKQLDDGHYDAIILAEAGLQRLALKERIVEVLPLSWMLPAVGQGALGLEIRTDDAFVRTALKPLNDSNTFHSVIAERSMLSALSGGCLAPIGAWGRVVDDSLHLDAAVLSLDGQQRVSAEALGNPDDADSLGRDVADQLRSQGADQLIAAARDANS